MSFYTISNEQISVTVNSKGAELTHLIKDGREYMWNADPAYWNRISPVLFPIVGKVKNNEYTLDGRTYALNQHGFARDGEFTLVQQTENALFFRFTSDADTLKKYPFPFSLTVGYTLCGSKVEVSWQVENTGDREMPFSIGAHPAFLCDLTKHCVAFDCEKLARTPMPTGYAESFTKEVPLEEGIFTLTPEAFDEGAFIIENHQAHKVSLLDENKVPYVTVAFEAPLFGVWSPLGKNAPFLCIEPWYGRCDGVDHDGDFRKKAYMNFLAGGDTFRAAYTIQV